MDDKPGLVGITFIRDIRPRDTSVIYPSGSHWLVDPATAAGLIMAGVAVKAPNQLPQTP
jgi:hypothetical protein